MSREERGHMLDEEISKLSVDEQNFVLWGLLRTYSAKIEIPKEIATTIEDYRRDVFNTSLRKACDEIIEMLEFELWR